MHISDLLRWILAVVFGLFGWWMISANFWIVYAWLARRQRGSMIPPLGAFFALAGMAFCPLIQIRRLAWIPVAVDLGFFFSVMAIGFLMHLFAERAKKGKDHASD
jgi:hypothetical protein